MVASVGKNVLVCLMIEFVKHAFGLCGEPHPSLLMPLIALVGYLVKRIRKLK